MSLKETLIWLAICVADILLFGGPSYLIIRHLGSSQDLITLVIWFFPMMVCICLCAYGFIGIKLIIESPSEPLPLTTPEET